MVESQDIVLVTGANGFIGSRVVKELLLRGFNRIRCLTRATSPGPNLNTILEEFGRSGVELVHGNLLSPDTCNRATRDAKVIYHLAAGVEKTFPGCFLNSAVTTRNLIDAASHHGTLSRFVNVSSLSVYSNSGIPRGGVLDETCPIENRFVERHDAYAFGKAEQDNIVREYGKNRHLPYVIVRPGITFGPGKPRIPGRVGIDTFGVFMHLGLGNRMPFTYVENCAEAIVLAGLKPGIDTQEINIVDDDLPSSSQFLSGYKRQVQRIRTIPVPYSLFYMFNAAWEKYSSWSHGQLPPVFNRLICEAYYKAHYFSNRKAKELLGWRPKVSMADALKNYYAYVREQQHVRQSGS